MAIDALIAKGLIAAVCIGGRSGFQLNRPVVPDPRRELDWPEREVVERIRRGQRPRKWEASAVQLAIDRGWLLRGADEALSIAAPPPLMPCWIWLPNSIVTGVANETPPLERVRQTQDPLTLRLFLELYAEGHPRADGGVRHSLIRSEFERKQIGQSGPLVVWGSRDLERKWVTWDGAALCHRVPASKDPGDDFFRRFNQLTDTGLIEWMPHLMDGSGPEAEIIHPYGLGASDSIEDRLGLAAHHAGIAKLTREQATWASTNGYWLAPVPRHIGNVAVIGVARLRYRPQTAATGAWWRNLLEQAETHLAVYQGLQHQLEGSTGPSIGSSTGSSMAVGAQRPRAS